VPPDPVRQQYERWIYPPPIEELDRASLEGPHSNFKDFRALHRAYWPAEPYREDRDILVAGCGTVAAACYALLYPQARVFGIDISQASLAHEERLKAKYGLSNLRLECCPIEEVATLGRAFDFIATHGVLHHLVDPEAGLRALAQTLRPNGVVAIMVYAKYGRAGVYLLQEFCRQLHLGQEPEDVATVRQALSALGPKHPLQPYLGMATDLHADEGIVDTFLHPRDRPYSVADCLQLLDGAGLVLQGWDESIFYYPDAAFARLPPDSLLRRRLGSLSNAELWKAMEVFDARNPGHFFYACRADRDPANYRLDFMSAAFLSYVPVPRFTRFTPACSTTRRPATVERAPLPVWGLPPVHEAVFARIDGHRNVAECLSGLSFAGEAERLQFGQAFCRLYWRLGFLLFALPPNGSTELEG
jgi:SAM-dependent methyltransferase